VKFKSTKEALDWAETIISIREGGRSNAAMMELLGNGGTPKDYQILDAIEIRSASRLACWDSLPCPDQRPRCLFHWHLPDPCVEHPRLSDAQVDRICACDGRFASILRRKGFLE